MHGIAQPERAETIRYKASDAALTEALVVLALILSICAVLLVVGTGAALT